MSLLKWAELREEEFEDAAKAANGLCIVPVGCYEMHGQHLPVRTDVYQAEAVANAAAELETADFSDILPECSRISIGIFPSLACTRPSCLGYPPER